MATDLQGNLRDYTELKRRYFAEKAAGNEPVLLLCGDLVHGPGPALSNPADWPDFLGTFYRDESLELILDFEVFSRTERALALLGNHEHAHVGGPVVSKFYDDEAAVLDAALGEERERIHAFMRSFPLLAVSRCGGVFTHAAPRAWEPDLEAFERIQYAGYETASITETYERDTLGPLLWARHADPERARAFLAATALDGRPGTFVVYGHDVVREGYEKVGDEQLCLSTSFGLEDRNKYSLRLDLSRRYRSVHDLHLFRELLPLYP